MLRHPWLVRTFWAVAMLICGMAGWLGTATIAHLWTDHQNLHALVQVEQQRQLMIQRTLATTPAPDVPPK